MTSLAALGARYPYSIEVENHLDEYRRGQGKKNDPISSQLARLDQSNAALFSNTNTQAASLYGAYSTAFSYDQRARYVYNLGSLNASTAALNKAYDISQKA